MNQATKGFNQHDIDRLFYSIVMAKISYGRSISGSSPAEPCTVQRFLTRSFTRKYCSTHRSPSSDGFLSTQLYICHLLEKSDKNSCQKVRKLPNHPLKAFILIAKILQDSLGNPSGRKLFQNTLNNHIFKFNLMSLFLGINKIGFKRVTQ